MESLWLVFIGSWLTITYSVFRIFKEAEETVRPEVSKAASNWLNNVLNKKVNLNWGGLFSELFDKVFSKDHWSWKCFYRSSIVSLAAFILISLVHYVQFKKTFAYNASSSISDFITTNANSYKIAHLANMAIQLVNNNEIIDYSNLNQVNNTWIDSLKSLKYSKDTFLIAGNKCLLRGGNILPVGGTMAIDYNDLLELKTTYNNWKINLSKDPGFRSTLMRIATEKSSESRENQDEINRQAQKGKYWLKYLDNPFIIIYLFLFNLIMDYFSLLETRYLLALISKSKSRLSRLGYLVLDALLTFVIFIVTWKLLIDLLIYLQQSVPLLKAQDLVPYIEAIRFHDIKSIFNINNNISVVFYTTFVTSIWLWMFGLSGIFIKLFNVYNIGLDKLNKWFDVDKKPFKSMGFILMILITGFYLAWGIYLISP